MRTRRTACRTGSRETCGAGGATPSSRSLQSRAGSSTTSWALWMVSGGGRVSTAVVQSLSSLFPIHPPPCSFSLSSFLLPPSIPTSFSLPSSSLPSLPPSLPLQSLSPASVAHPPSLASVVPRPSRRALRCPTLALVLTTRRATDGSGLLVVKIREQLSQRTYMYIHASCIPLL